MNKSLVVFASDQRFLAPLLVPCLQIVEQGLTRVADIVVYLVDVDPAIHRALEEHIGPRGVRFEPLDSRLLASAARADFIPSHVPVVALARLVLGEMIPDQYENIVYLDCDIQVVGDIKPLLTHQVPEGKIAAARSSLWLLEGERRRSWERDYLDGLGDGVSIENYFNAGVMAFRRETWREIGPQALEFFLANARACKLMDQSALNVVCADRVVSLSPAYNFLTSYSKPLILKACPPRILHFIGPGKPWSSASPPWNGRFLADYARIFDEFPFLRGSLDTMPPPGVVGRFGAATRRSLSTLRHPRLKYRKMKADRFVGRKFLEYVENADFPF